jgi:hypothetical protein
MCLKLSSSKVTESNNRITKYTSRNIESFLPGSGTISAGHLGACDVQRQDMFPGDRLHDDKQDLFSVGCDEQQQFSEGQDVSVFPKSLFSRIQDLDVIQRQKVSFAKDHATQNLAQELSGGRVTQQNFHEFLRGGSSSQCPDQEIFRTEEVTKHDFLPEGHNYKPQGVFPEGSVAKLQDENVFSEYYSSQQTVPSETSVNEPYDEVRVSGCRDDQSSVEDNISRTHNNQNTFPTDHVTRRVGQNVLSRSLAVQQSISSEGHATRQGVISEEHILEQGVFTGGRLNQRLGIRTAPRQLDMGK